MKRLIVFAAVLAIVIVPSLAADRPMEMSFGLDGVVFDNNDRTVEAAWEWRFPIWKRVFIGPVVSWTHLKVDGESVDSLGLGGVGRYVLGSKSNHVYLSVEALALTMDQEGYFVAPGVGVVLGGGDFFIDVGVDRPFRGDTAGSIVDEDSWRTRARLGLRF